MSSLDHFRLMAPYNAWMNARLYVAAERLTADEIARDRGAFFGSILGTLNHLVASDLIWFGRLANHPPLSGRLNLAGLPEPAGVRFTEPNHAVAGVDPTGLTLAQYGGNHVVQDLGNGNFAFYAHLKTGTVNVKPGDRLSTGQVLGSVGNTGNSSAPHLHFHVMSTPDPLRADR